MKDGDFMRNRLKKRKYRKPLLALLLAFVVFFTTICYYYMQPVILQYAVSVAETIMLNSANEAIVNIFGKGSVSYRDIINLSSDEDGYVTSLEVNALQVNNLKSKISNEIWNIISDRETYSLQIPIGSFLGNTYTNGFGPLVTFKMQITTTAYVDFSHKFESAGINQVLHIVNVDIDIKGNFVVIGFHKSIAVSTTAIAAQTVIVGKTPDAFTNVLESPMDNTGGLINDYGAIAE